MSETPEGGAIPQPVPESTSSPKEEAQPELGLTPLSESTERALSPEELQRKDKAIVKSAGDATIILKRGATEISILDPQGEQIPLPTELTIANWEDVESPLDPNNPKIVRGLDDVPIGATNYKGLTTLPPRLQEYAKRELDNLPPEQREIPLPTKNWKIDTTNLKDLTVDVGDGCVMFYQPGTDSYIAYQTQNSRGDTLAPSNWERVDTLNAATRNLISETRNRIKYVDAIGVQSLQYTEAGRPLIVFGDRVEIGTPPQVSDNIQNVGNNIAEDPSSPETIYFCSEDAREIHKVSPGVLTADIIPLPQSYSNVENLRFEKTGNFLTFSAGDKFVVLEKDTLQEVSSIADIYHGSLDAQGRLHGVNAEGKLVSFEVNFQPLVEDAERRKAEAQAEAARVPTPEELEQKRREAMEKKYAHLADVRDTLIDGLGLDTLNSLDQFDAIRNNVDVTIQNLRNQGATNEQIDEFYRPELERAVTERERAIATQVSLRDLGALRGIVDPDTPMDFEGYSRAGELRATLQDLKNKGLLSEESITAMRELDEQFHAREQVFKREQSEQIFETTTDVMRRLTQELTVLTSTTALADWEDDGSALSTLKIELGNLGRLFTNRQGEMEPDIKARLLQTETAIAAAIKARRDALREKEAVSGVTATDVLNEQYKLFKTEIGNLVDLIRGKGMTDRSAIYEHPRYADLKDRVDELRAQEPEQAQELRRLLGVSVALYLSEKERIVMTGAEGSTRPMVMLGDVPFPVWENPPQPKHHRRVDLDFIIDPKASAQIVDGKPVILGEIGITEQRGVNGKTETVRRRVYEGKPNKPFAPQEDAWRSGSVEFMGEYAPGTIVTDKEFKEIKRQYTREWEKGLIQQELKEKKQSMYEAFQQRPVLLPDGSEMTLGEAREHNQQLRDNGETVPMFEEQNDSGVIVRKEWKPVASSDWEDRYTDLLQEYGEYAAEKHVLLFSHIDSLRNGEPVEEASSVGYIPEWDSLWTIDEQTAKDLGRMATLSKEQLKLKQGITNLEGHAGTGKDVLIKMFCNLTNRPYFAFDGSKWTVESDLAEDISLEDGSVVKIPSAVLQSIQTPGAVLYFNEFNAMPEPTQIFLHSLLDAKRSLTLKTTGGVTVKALPSVLMFSSMNPGYPGTFDPQFATRSRMDYLPIDYSPFTKEPDPTDPNRNPAFSAAEALRVARGVESLEEYTYDLNLDHNEFVQIWDKYINKIDNGARDITPQQEFDLRTIFALVQFTQKLREGFIKTINKPPKPEYDVPQPMTGRELAKCAEMLSNMDPSSKTASKGSSPEDTAKMLLREKFLTKVTAKKDRDKIEEDMRTWSVKERAA